MIRTLIKVFLALVLITYSFNFAARFQVFEDSTLFDKQGKSYSGTISHELWSNDYVITNKDGDKAIVKYEEFSGMVTPVGGNSTLSFIIACMGLLFAFVFSLLSIKDVIALLTKDNNGKYKDSAQ